MIKNTDVPIMKDAVRVIYDMSDDTRIKEIARLREKAMHDEASALGNARREGIEEGRSEGRVEGVEEVINKMRKSGMPEEQIKKYSIVEVAGFSPDTYILSFSIFAKKYTR